jgi:hypothetical protein
MTADCPVRVGADDLASLNTGVVDERKNMQKRV